MGAADWEPAAGRLKAHRSSRLSFAPIVKEHGARRGPRTRNFLIKSQVLCPLELAAHGRGPGDRTHAEHPNLGLLQVHKTRPHTSAVLHKWCLAGVPAPIIGLMRAEPELSTEAMSKMAGAPGFEPGFTVLETARLASYLTPPEQNPRTWRGSG